MQLPSNSRLTPLSSYATLKPSPKPYNSITTMSLASQQLYSRPTLAQAAQIVDFPTMKPTMTSTYYTLSSHYVISTHMYLTTWWFINKKLRFLPEYTHFHSQLTKHNKQTPLIKDPTPLNTTPPTTLFNLTLNLYLTQCTHSLKIPQLSHHTPQTPPLNTPSNHKLHKEQKNLNKRTTTPHRNLIADHHRQHNTLSLHKPTLPLTTTLTLKKQPNPSPRQSYTPSPNPQNQNTSHPKNTKHTPIALTYSQWPRKPQSCLRYTNAICYHTKLSNYTTQSHFTLTPHTISYNRTSQLRTDNKKYTQIHPQKYRNHLS